MGAHEEEDEERQENQHAHERVVEGDVAEAAGHQQGDHGDYGDEGGGRLLLVLLVPIDAVEHDEAAGGHANQHLDDSEEGAETGDIPERHAGVRPRHALHNGPHAQIVGVRKLRDEARARENGNALLEGRLAHLRNRADSVRQNNHGEGERGKEPRGRVPDLRVHGEPGLEKEGGKERVPAGNHRAAVEVIHEHEHRGKDHLHDEEKGIVSHDASDDVLRLVLCARARLTLAKLCCDITSHVSGKHEECSHNHINLRGESQDGRVPGRAGDEVAGCDVGDQEKADGVQSGQAGLRGRLGGGGHGRLIRGAGFQGAPSRCASSRCHGVLEGKRDQSRA
mmetsp:Transcript_28884/g.63246  ORF Transcript_28884/g.63246 Transcript_28884/m.63246 type:complete len:337 (+) Transcript_28884:581-1591(+)